MGCLSLTVLPINTSPIWRIKKKKKKFISWITNRRYSTASTSCHGLDAEHLAHGNLGIISTLFKKTDLHFTCPKIKEPPKMDNFEHAKQIQHQNHGSDKVTGSICILYLERSFYKKAAQELQVPWAISASFGVTRF